MRKQTYAFTSIRRMERRAHPERRRYTAAAPDIGQGQPRVPSRLEQTIQFLTRYLFCALGLLFFNTAFPEQPRVLPRELINLAFIAYVFTNTGFFLHAMYRPGSRLRYRLAMWVDIAMVSMSLAADPNDIPPSAMAYIMVVLGNGMRYGLPLFAEAMLVSFGGAMVALSLRLGPADGVHPGLLFLNLFGGIILIYAFILMMRLEANRRRLERNSHRDPLTGLLNRRGLQVVAERLFLDANTNGRHFAVMFADMDNFKQVNDRYGHSAGDQVLREVGHILKMSLRDSDIAGRYGGDEFIIILPQTTPADAILVARRIQQKIASWSEDNALQCSLTVGVGQAPTDGDTLEAIMHRVDQAMYANKGGGGGIGIASGKADTSTQGAATETA
jgi:diguanylate cyclase (GGDEF)-like protein